MSVAIREIQGRRVLECPPEGPLLRQAETVDLIGEALGEDFFRLRTGVAGEVVQKFVTYRRGLAILGDISAHVAGSEALRDFLVESNRGRHVWFVRDMAELETRLAET